MKKTVMALMVAGVSLFAQNTNVNLQISNSTIGVYAESGLTQNNIKARGFYLYNDNSNKNNFYLAGIKAEGNLIGMNVENMKFSLIADFVHTKNNSAVPLGFGVFSYIPNISLPVFVRMEAEYAPKILSFDDANRFSRVDINIGYKPIVNAEIFAGYRNISFNQNYNSVFYAGLGYGF